MNKKCISKVINEARKSGNVTKFSKFGRLARGAGWLFGWADIPIELAFALPHLLSGNVQDAKAATTAGWFGYGGKKLEQIDPEENPEAYKYFKHIQDINTWMEAYNQQQEAESELGKFSEDWANYYKKHGDKSGYTDRVVDRYLEAVAIQKEIGENYQGYKTPEGEEDWNAQRIAKEKAKDFLREREKKEWEEGVPLKVDFTGMTYREPFNNKPYRWTPFKEDKITSLEQQIAQKGESFYGGFMRPGVKAAAERLGTEDLYDDWYDAYYGKDPRDAYSSLPLDWTGQLANLEEKELYQGLADKLMRPGGAELKQSLIEQGFDMDKFRKYGLQITAPISRAGGGLASLLKK